MVLIFFTYLSHTCGYIYCFFLLKFIHIPCLYFGHVYMFIITFLFFSDSIVWFFHNLFHFPILKTLFFTQFCVLYTWLIIFNLRFLKIRVLSMNPLWSTPLEELALLFVDNMFIIVIFQKAFSCNFDFFLFNGSMELVILIKLFEFFFAA